jgi:hypothetical protein
LPPFKTATFGDAFTETDFALAVWSTELNADWSWLDEPYDSPDDWLWSFSCDESFEFAAAAAADESDDWSTLPPFATATLGDALTETAVAEAVWSIEFVADWL